MKLSALPLLEGNSVTPLSLDMKDSSSLSPRQFVDLLDTHKALLLRSSPESFDVERFGDFLTSLELKKYPYIGGAAPRTVIPVAAGEDIIFTANESPPQEPIPFHHELAQCPEPPEYVFFYCESPAEEGGQTPIIDSTLVYRYANENFPDFIDKLKQYGVRYIRTMPAEDDPSSPIGRSYKNCWGASSPEELETKLAAIDGCSWDWQTDGSVRVTTEPVPALRLVTDYNQNQVFQWTFANSIVAAYLGWQDARNDRHDALRFGNGDKMQEDALQCIADFMQSHRILHTWQHGDVMALNNRLVMHSRNPFVGKRRVLASIWGGLKDSVRLSQTPSGVNVGVLPSLLFESISSADPLVFGFWKVPKKDAADVCYKAIEAGYRRLDCACDYGNEPEVGQGIARALLDGLCTRDELFVTSKLWNTYHRPEHVPLAIERSLQDMGLSYLDEYLIHFPISMEFVPFDEKYPPEWTNKEGRMALVKNDMGLTWKAMEDLVDKGLSKTIGVCNFSTQMLRQILSTCRIRPAALQVELHPHNSQVNLLRFARESGMRVTAFSALGASSYVAIDMATEQEMLIHDKTVKEIAEAKNKTPAQVLLRWAVQRNTQPLTKTVRVERMKENRDVFDFYLTGLEMKQLSLLNTNRRYNDPGVFCEKSMGTFCPIYE